MNLNFMEIVRQARAAEVAEQEARGASELRIAAALRQLIHSPLSECDWDEAIEALVEHDRLTAWDNRNAK